MTFLITKCTNKGTSQQCVIIMERVPVELATALTPLTMAVSATSALHYPTIPLHHTNFISILYNHRCIFRPNTGYSSGWPSCCNDPGGDVMNCPIEQPPCESDGKVAACGECR